MGIINLDDIAVEAPKNDFSPLPEGNYNAHVAEVEERTTKAGNGKYSRIEFKIADDLYVGRRIWHNVTIENPNPKAVEIGMKQLVILAKAAGLSGEFNTDNMNELVGAKVNLKLTIEDSEQYGNSNRVQFINLAKKTNSQVITEQSKTDEIPF